MNKPVNSQVFKKETRYVPKKEMLAHKTLQ